MTTVQAGLAGAGLALIGGTGLALWQAFGGDVWFSYLAGAFLACF